MGILRKLGVIAAETALIYSLASANANTMGYSEIVMPEQIKKEKKKMRPKQT